MHCKVELVQKGYKFTSQWFSQYIKREVYIFCSIHSIASRGGSRIPHRRGRQPSRAVGGRPLLDPLLASHFCDMFLPVQRDVFPNSLARHKYMYILVIRCSQYIQICALCFLQKELGENMRFVPGTLWIAVITCRSMCVDLKLVQKDYHKV